MAVDTVVQQHALRVKGKRHYTQLDNGFVRCGPYLSDGEFRLYVVLLQYAWFEDTCFPSQETLSRDMGKATVKSIRDHIASLMAKGILAVVEKGNGRGHANVYELLDSEEAIAVLKTQNESGEAETTATGLSLIKGAKNDPFIKNGKGVDFAEKGCTNLPPNKTNVKKTKSVRRKPSLSPAERAIQRKHKAEQLIADLPPQEREEIEAIFAVDAFAPFRDMPNSVNLALALLRDRPLVDVPQEAKRCAADREAKGIPVKAFTALDNWIRKATWPLVQRGDQPEAGSRYIESGTGWFVPDEEDRRWAAQ